MVGGQVIDLQSEGREVGLEVLEELQRGKTAALLTAACEMGCLLAGGTAEQRQAARIYGENVGLGFQIIDDILDATSTPEELGKPVGGRPDPSENHLCEPAGDRGGRPPGGAADPGGGGRSAGVRF